MNTVEPDSCSIIWNNEGKHMLICENGNSVCVVCGASIPGHIHTEEWKHDSTSHWHECSCGEKCDISEHIEDEGTYAADYSATPSWIIRFNCSVCGEYMRKMYISEINISSDRVTVNLIGENSSEVIIKEYEFKDIPVELVEIMPFINLSLVIDFVNNFSAADDDMILTSAQMKAIETVLEYDMSR